MTLIEAFCGWKYNRLLIKLEKFRSREAVLLNICTNSKYGVSNYYLDKLIDAKENIAEINQKLKFWGRHAN